MWAHVDPIGWAPWACAPAPDHVKSGSSRGPSAGQEATGLGAGFIGCPTSDGYRPQARTAGARSKRRKTTGTPPRLGPTECSVDAGARSHGHSIRDRADGDEPSQEQRLGARVRGSVTEPVGRQALWAVLVLRTFQPRQRARRRCHLCGPAGGTVRGQALYDSGEGMDGPHLTTLAHQKRT